MDLVIIGAGGYGQTVGDIASQTGEYDNIFYLDDNPNLSFIKGKCSEYVNYKKCAVYPAFGNNASRLNWIQKLIDEGYYVPTIIHSSAYISPSATIDIGTVILPNAVVNTDVLVGKGCIINLGALIDHGCIIEDGCHICLGAIVKGENRISGCTKIQAGIVIEHSVYAI